MYTRELLDLIIVVGFFFFLNVSESRTAVLKDDRFSVTEYAQSAKITQTFDSYVPDNR